MRLLILIVVLLAGIGATILLFRGHVENRAEAYAGLRELALTVQPEEYSGTTRKDDVWGVIVDTHDIIGQRSIVAFADGTVSIYSSNGPFLIGAGRDPEIRSLADALIKAAADAQSSFKDATTHALPEKGRWRFFARVGTRVRFTETSTNPSFSDDAMSNLAIAHARLHIALLKKAR